MLVPHKNSTGLGLLKVYVGLKVKALPAEVGDVHNGKLEGVDPGSGHRAHKRL